MNIGNLPGFYWDEDKKKYFKILANHVAPSDAKYSKTTVKNEDRARKKRKLAERKEHVKLKQTVRRPMQNPLLNAAGLDRESGCHATQGSMTVSKDAAFVANLTPRAEDWPCTVLDFCPEAFGGVVALSDMGRSTIYRNKSTAGGLTGVSKSMAAFHSTLVYLDVSSDSAIIGIAQERRSYGNVYIGASKKAEFLTGFDGMYIDVGPVGVTDFSIWSASRNRGQDRIAISGSQDIYCLDLRDGGRAAEVQRLPYENESRDVAWLDNNVIAYGHRDLNLWDIRSSGSATRFSKNASSPITGVISPNSEGVQLLISDNRKMELRDTRMATKGPVMTWSHSHQGAKLPAAVQEELQIVAAADLSNSVQTYSLRSGKCLGALKSAAATQSVGLHHHLKWHDLDGDISLQSCRGYSVVTWGWAGTE